MRIGFLLLTLCAAAMAADPDFSSTLVTPTRTPTADAPAFGTGNYFKKVFANESPRLELRPPVRLGDFVVGDKMELSLKNYIELVLANNTDLQIQRLSVEIPRNDILRQYSIFDPIVGASFTSRRTKQPTNDVLAGATELNQLTQPLQINASQLLPTGTTWNFSFNGAKNSTNSAFTSYNPAITSALNFGFTQPLLRSRGTFYTKLPIIVAQGRLIQSRFDIQSTLLTLVTTAENAYWDVVLAREQLKVQEQNLALNEQFLKRTRRELELGAISQLDVYQPEAQYKNAELAVTQARYQLQSVEDALRRQMSADIDPTVRKLPLVLLEDLAPPSNNVFERDEIVDRAIRQRPDLLSVRQSMSVDDVLIRGTANRLLPDLRLIGGYGSFGRGGTFYQRDNVFDQNGNASTIVNATPGGLGDSLNQLFGFGFPSWNFGVSLTLPLRDRNAAANYADAVVSKRLDMLRLRSQEQFVRQQVLNAITDTERSRASIEIAQVALELAQKRLDAEQKKFDLGTTTLFFVLDAQTQYNTSKSNLVNQTVNYRRNLTTLGRVTGDLLAERNITVQ